MALTNATVNTLVEARHTTLFRYNLLVALPRPASEVTIGSLVDNAKEQMDQTLFSDLMLVSPSPSKENNSAAQHIETYGEPRLRLRFISTPPPTSDPVQKMLEAFKEQLETALRKEKLERETALQKERLERQAAMQVLQVRITTLEQTLETSQHGIAMRGFIDAIEHHEGTPRGNRVTWWSQNAGRLALLAGVPEPDLTNTFLTVRTEAAHNIDSSCVAHAIADMDPADGQAGFEKLFFHYLGHAVEDEIEGRVAPTRIIGGFPPRHGPPQGPPFTPTPTPAPAPAPAPTHTPSQVM